MKLTQSQLRSIVEAAGRSQRLKITPKDAIRQFAAKYGLEAKYETVDGDRFYCAIKPGADVTFDGWIAAEDPDGENVMLRCSSDDECNEDKTMSPEELIQQDPAYVRSVIDSWSP